MAVTKEKKFDPITDTHLAGWFLWSSGILVLVTAWATWDEIVTRRPWKGHQIEFKSLAAEKFDQDLEAANAVLTSKKYLDLKKIADDAQAAFVADPQVQAIDKEMEETQTKYDRFRKQFQIQRGNLQEAQYYWEQARGDAERQKAMLTHIRSLEEGDPAKGVLGTTALSRGMTEADLKKKELKNKRLELRKPLDEAQRKVGELVAPIERIARLKSNVENSAIVIRQIINRDLDMVDRCESCHVAMRLAGFPKGEKFHNPYASHPGNFLKTHNVDSIGCTSCHRGQGYATSNPPEAHGISEFWLDPMLQGSDAQAMCIKCHDQQVVIPDGDKITKGRQLVQDMGCWGCHKIRGFDREESRLGDARLARDMVTSELAKARDQAAKSPDDAALAARVTDLDGQARQALKAYDEAMKEFRQIGPDLTRIKSKVYPGFFEVWLTRPKSWRPTTRMPNFFLTEEERKAIAAYLWQNSDGPNLDRHPLDPPAEVKDKVDEGKVLFGTSGCQACHAINLKNEKGALEPQGGDFAPNLSKVGEKITYEYLVEWILDPKKFQPNGRMPNLRITREQAEKIAAYLTTLKIHDPSRTEPEIPTRGIEYLQDLSLAELGKKKIQRFGCFSCHNIRGFEGAGKIGVELTAVYAKLVHQFDFGLLEHQMKEKYQIHDRDEWHSRAKAIWIREKISDPRQWDTDRDETKKGDDRLRMPKFDLEPDQIDALVCFLQAQDGKEVPMKYRYRPGGAKEALIEGEKLIRKYNCIGCHQFDVDKITLKNGGVVTGLPTTEDDKTLFLQLHSDSPELGKKASETVKIAKADIAEHLPAFGGVIIPYVTQALVSAEVISDPVEAPPFLPPVFVHEGEKVQSGWLFQFLKAPFTLRPWVTLKMPTFDMSDAEAQAIARFFAARNARQYPFEFNKERHKDYLAEKLKADPNFLKNAQVLFGPPSDTNKDTFNCQTCHVKGAQNPKGSPENWAPDLLMAKDRLRPEWIVQWLHNPKMLQPGTRMPLFPWGTPDTQKSFPGNADDQIGAIKDLLMNMGVEPAAPEKPK